MKKYHQNILIIFLLWGFPVYADWENCQLSENPEYTAEPLTFGSLYLSRSSNITDAIKGVIANQSDARETSTNSQYWYVYESHSLKSDHSGDATNPYQNYDVVRSHNKYDASYPDNIRLVATQTNTHVVRRSCITKICTANELVSLDFLGYNNTHESLIRRSMCSPVGCKLEYRDPGGLGGIAYLNSGATAEFTQTGEFCTTAEQTSSDNALSNPDNNDGGGNSGGGDNTNQTNVDLSPIIQKQEITNTKLEEIKNNTGQTNTKLDSINTKIESTNNKLQSIDDNVGQVNTGINTANEKLEGIQGNTSTTNNLLQGTNQSLLDISTGQSTANDLLTEIRDKPCGGSTGVNCESTQQSIDQTLKDLREDLNSDLENKPLKEYENLEEELTGKKQEFKDQINSRIQEIKSLLNVDNLSFTGTKPSFEFVINDKELSVDLTKVLELMAILGVFIILLAYWHAFFIVVG